MNPVLNSPIFRLALTVWLDWLLGNCWRVAGPVGLLEVGDNSLGLIVTSDTFNVELWSFEMHPSKLTPSDTCPERLRLEDGSSFLSDSVISIHSGVSILPMSVEFLFEDSLKLWIRKCNCSIFWWPNVFPHFPHARGSGTK